MTKPFTRISSIRQATGSIYSPFALARGSRETIKGGDGDFGTDTLGPHAERALDRPGRRAAMVPAEPWCESRLSSRGKKTWSRPFWQAHRGGVQQTAPRPGRKPSGFPHSRRTVLFSGGRRGPGHPRGGQGPAAGRQARPAGVATSMLERGSAGLWQGRAEAAACPLSGTAALPGPRLADKRGICWVTL